MTRVFISYRRDDSAAYAGRLYDRLTAHFGEGQVFMDIDQIEPGEDFVEAIQRTVSACETAVILIGKGWLNAADSEGKRRLDDPDDFVRLDGLCVELLREFYGWLQAPGGEALSPAEASPLAHAADRFLRDFLVDFLERGPADADPAAARQYVGNWYVVHTLNPTHREIDVILRSLQLLSRYLAEEGIVTEEVSRSARDDLSGEAHFHKRLEDFWELTSEGIPVWRAVDDYRRKPPPPVPEGTPLR
jgi:hypothetical protein